MNSGTGPAAAMSYPLGVHFGVPHGIGGGIFLPHVIEHNLKAGCYDYAGFNNGVNSNHKINKDLAKEFSELIWDTWELLNVPKDITVFGMNSSHIDRFVLDTMDLKGALDQNPVSFCEEEIKLILNNLNVG